MKRLALFGLLLTAVAGIALAQVRGVWADSCDVDNYAIGTCAAPVHPATTASLGGSLLLAGACTTSNVTVAGATSSMVAVASPNTYPGDGVVWNARVSAADTVAVRVCSVVLATPTASTYNVRVIR